MLSPLLAHLVQPQAEPDVDAIETDLRVLNQQIAESGKDLNKQRDLLFNMIDTCRHYGVSESLITFLQHDNTFCSMVSEDTLCELTNAKSLNDLEVHMENATIEAITKFLEALAEFFRRLWVAWQKTLGWTQLNVKRFRLQLASVQQQLKKMDQQRDLVLLNSQFPKYKAMYYSVTFTVFGAKGAEPIPRAGKDPLLNLIFHDEVMSNRPDTNKKVSVVSTIAIPDPVSPLYENKITYEIPFTPLTTGEHFFNILDLFNTDTLGIIGKYIQETIKKNYQDPSLLDTQDRYNLELSKQLPAMFADYVPGQFRTIPANNPDFIIGTVANTITAVQTWDRALKKLGDVSNRLLEYDFDQSRKIRQRNSEINALYYKEVQDGGDEPTERAKCNARLEAVAKDNTAFRASLLLVQKFFDSVKDAMFSRMDSYMILWNITIQNAK